MVDAGADATAMRFEKIAVIPATAPDEQAEPEAVPDEPG